MRPGSRNRALAVVLSLAAAFLWATYYLFVLGVGPGTRASALLFYPFLGGAVGFGAWALARGEARSTARLFLEPSAYLRVGLMLAMQTSVLAATFLTGPVDASLLSLLGDVVLTPLVVAALVAAHRPELRAPAFVLGLLLSLAGGTLAILGGRPPSSVHGVGWTVVAVVPVAVAFFFVLSARAARDRPVDAVLAQVMLGAALGALGLAPLLPGGLGAIIDARPLPLVLLLVNGLLSFFLAQICYFGAIARTGLVLPPMLMTGIPVFTLLLSDAVLGLAPAALALLGVPVAVVGGILALSAGGGGRGGEGGSTGRPGPVSSSR